ncbi:hypothetical protein BJ166DRAFT_525220 [Pestalotiopsis sp. NC0098]|nr:hypothetical protein BJ166DRAFT_525220 [Pestalotiopsis sp. NC0098]
MDYGSMISFVLLLFYSRLPCIISSSCGGRGGSKDGLRDMNERRYHLLRNWGQKEKRRFFRNFLFWGKMGEKSTLPEDWVGVFCFLLPRESLH